MANPRLSERIDALEVRVDRLDELPARMGRLEGQILDLRSEVREQFSLTRSHADQRFDEAIDHGGRRFDEAMSAMRALHDKATAHTDEAIAGVRTHMLVLHEEVLERISRLGEGRQSRKKR